MTKKSRTTRDDDGDDTRKSSTQAWQFVVGIFCPKEQIGRRGTRQTSLRALFSFRFPDIFGFCQRAAVLALSIEHSIFAHSAAQHYENMSRFHAITTIEQQAQRFDQFVHIVVERGMTDIQPIALFKLLEVHWQSIGLRDLRAV
jgi:hypothetical protein